jgi:hypothetical protein
MAHVEDVLPARRAMTVWSLPADSSVASGPLAGQVP